MSFCYKIPTVSPLNFNSEVRITTHFAKKFLQRVQTTRTLDKTRSNTTLVNGSNFTFNTTYSQQYYLYLR